MFRFAFLFCAAVATAQISKPLPTLDEFFDAVDIRRVRISPDGHAVAIETARADWEANRFRSDVWLYRDDGAGSLIQLTRSGHDHDPEWSPDGRWIAFLSDREGSEAAGKGDDKEDGSEKSEKPDQVWAIALNGGEAFPVTHGEEKFTLLRGRPIRGKSTSPRAHRGARNGRRLIRRIGKTWWSSASRSAAMPSRGWRSPLAR
jgi:dipeptidyl aminopeptidase/acylaminoacyl peptidase